MDISVLFRVLLERKWILILIPLAAAAITFAVMSNMPNEYKSKAQISTGFTINNDVIQLDGNYNAREAEVKFGNLMETMKSPILIGMLSYRMMLHDLTADYPFKNIEQEKLISLRSSPNNYVGKLSKQELVNLLEAKLDSIALLTSYKENEKEAIQLLRFYGYDYDAILRNLQVKRANFSDYINIEYTSTNPELSAFATNVLVEELIRYNNQISSTRLDRSLDYYTRLVQQKREELDEKSDALKTFKASNQVINFNAENEANVSQIANLEIRKQEEERNVYRLRLAIDNLTRRLNEAGGGSGTGGVSNNARLIEVREEINNLNRQLRETNNPSLQRRIDSLRAVQIELAGASTAFSQDGQTVTRNDLLEEREQLRIELAVAERSLNSILSTLSLLKGNTTGLASKEATIAGLQREVDLAAQEYLEAQEKYNIARNTSQGSISTIKQVLFGQPAVKPESSKIWIFTALGWALSFSLCVVAIILLEFVDTSIKTVPQLENLSGIPVLGAINNIDSKRVDLGGVFSKNNDLDDVPEVELYRRLIRKIRYEIESKKSKVILVTSTKQGEGKSFLILSLAYSLSLIQKKVLIIDTNFKNNALTRMLIAKPRFDKLLEASNYKNPSKLLVSPDGEQFEDTSSAKDVKDKYKQTIISPTFLENIDIIGSRGGDESPAEILSGRNFREVLDELSADYDYIFLEGASLNDYSDSKELVEFSNLVLPVFSAQSVIKQMDRESIAYLKRLDGKLIGSVLNRVEMQDLNM